MGRFKECPYCHQPTIYDEGINWKRFFHYDEEGGFWQLLWFEIKWVLILWIGSYVITGTILEVVMKPQIQQLYCK